MKPMNYQHFFAPYVKGLSEELQEIYGPYDISKLFKSKAALWK